MSTVIMSKVIISIDVVSYKLRWKIQAREVKSRYKQRGEYISAVLVLHQGGQYLDIYGIASIKTHWFLCHIGHSELGMSTF